MASPLLDKLDLDDVLVQFKVYNRYHAVASIFIHLGMMYEFCVFFNYVFVTEDVRYRCVAFNSSSQNSSSISTTSYRENATTEWCKNPSACFEWVYDNPDSFAAEFDLACQEWKRTLVGSAHTFGYMAGLVTVGALSDRFGRKKLAIMTGVGAWILGTAKSFVTSYWLYVALEFIEAVIGDTFSPLFMMSLEIVATKSRVTYATICKTGLGIGGILLPLISWLIPNWRNFLRVLYAPGLLFILLYYLLDESPRWLLAKGKNSAAVKIIRNAAKLNKIEIEGNLSKISCDNDKGLRFVKVLRDMFKSNTLLKRFFLCFIWWAVCPFVNYGFFMNSISLAGDKYVNFGLLGTMKAVSIIVTGVFVNKTNRKGPLIFCLLACGALCLAQPLIPKYLHWLQIVNYMAGMLMSSMSFNIVNIFTSELFPTQARNSMFALCSSTGRTLAIFSPQTPLLRVYWSGLPTVLFGVLSLIAAFATLFVPDTSDQNLPDTVCQAEKLGTKLTTERRLGTVCEEIGLPL